MERIGFISRKERKELFNQESGVVVVIAGPMFSGKSEEAIAMAREIIYSKKKVVVFKPIIDNRRGENSINTFNGDSFPAVSVTSSNEILDHLRIKKPKPNAVIIDEGNFFDMGLVGVVEALADQGVYVIIAGLDKDFRGESFGPMGQLKQIANVVVSKHAKCYKCGRDAYYTQRLIVSENGKKVPASWNSETVVVGGAESYEARCRKHHEVPGRPDRKL